MALYPDIVSSFGDITQIGVEYSLETNDTLENELFSFDVPLGSAVSVTAKVAKRSFPDGQFAYFNIVDIFSNDGGVVTNRNQVDLVVLRGTTLLKATCYFKIVGTSVKIMCKNGVADQTFWKGLVALILV